jgi:hypothetical protein
MLRRMWLKRILGRRHVQAQGAAAAFVAGFEADAEAVEHARSRRVDRRPQRRLGTTGPHQHATLARLVGPGPRCGDRQFHLGAQGRRQVLAEQAAEEQDQPEAAAEGNHHAHAEAQQLRAPGARQLLLDV